MSNPTTDAASQDPKERKENIKKKKERTKPKESKKDSSASPYNKPMTEAETQECLDLLRKQGAQIKRDF